MSLSAYAHPSTPREILNSRFVVSSFRGHTPPSLRPPGARVTWALYPFSLLAASNGLLTRLHPLPAVGQRGTQYAHDSGNLPLLSA